MIIVGLIKSSQSRSTGYISKRSRQQALDQIAPLITDYQNNPGTIIFRFKVTSEHLKEVERVLTRAAVPYYKELEE